MFDHFSEQWAARRYPRFQLFVEGKEALQAFIQEISVRFDQMSDEHYNRAREDSRIQAAERRFIAAIELSEREGALRDSAVARYQLGMVCHTRGELAEAAEFMRAALAVLSSLPNRDRGPNMSACYYHLGVIALKRGDLPVAVRELRRSRQLDEANGDFHGLQSCDAALAACAALGVDIDAVTLPPSTDDDPWSAGPVTEPVFDESPAVEPTSKRDPGFYSRRLMIWLASQSVHANDALWGHLNSLGDEFGRPVSVFRAAFGSADPAQRKLSQPEPDQHLCATILVLEREGLHNRAFQELASYCRQRITTVPDFRLLVYLHDLTLAEVRDLSDREPFLAMLLDTTQLAESPSLEQLRRTLVPYVRQVERIRAAALWRSLRLGLSSAFGKLALVVLILAASLSFLGFPAWLLKSKLDWLGPYGPQLASLVLGVLAFPLQAPIIFLLLRGLRATANAPRSNVLLTRWIFAGTVIMLGANYFQHWLEGPKSWLFLGLAIGILLDSVRRAGRQAQRQAINVEELTELAIDPRMQDPTATVLRGDPLRPISCPLFPAPSVRVFISYTPSSAEGSRLAAALHRGLKEAGASPFLDRMSTPAGTSWQRTLNQHLGECDVFLCILDKKSVQREWVAAEFLGALEAHRLTGTPEIVLLVDPAIQRPSQPMLPVFRGVIAASSSPATPGRPQILELNAQTRASLIWALSPGQFLPTAVVTRTAALPLIGIMSLLGLIGSLGIYGGFILGFLAMLEKLAMFPFVSGLTNHGWLAPMTLLTAFWLGYTARATISWGYERDHGRDMGVTMPSISSFGLAYALFLFVPKVSPLYAAWSAVLALAGWLMVASVMRVEGEEARISVR